MMSEESILLEEFLQYYDMLLSVAWQVVEKEQQRLFFLSLKDQLGKSINVKQGVGSYAQHINQLNLFIYICFVKYFF